MTGPARARRGRQRDPRGRISRRAPLTMAVCPTCRRVVPTRPGTRLLANHGRVVPVAEEAGAVRRGGMCPGSGQPPAEASP